jgi:nucleotide-binding universal stress UspA family protein
MPTIDTRPKSGFERILLATDFSLAANVALAYAIRIAQRYLSTLELTTVIDLSMTASSQCSFGSSA